MAATKSDTSKILQTASAHTWMLSDSTRDLISKGRLGCRSDMNEVAALREYVPGVRKVLLAAVALCRIPSIWRTLRESECARIKLLEEMVDGVRPCKYRVKPAVSTSSITASLFRSFHQGAPPEYLGPDQVLEEVAERCLHRRMEMAQADLQARGRKGGLHVPGFRKVQADLVKDVIHNPFRPMPSLCNQLSADEAAEKMPCMDCEGIRNWNNATVMTMARDIYENRDYCAMTILGDALEDAGCVNAEILDHCRRTTPHTRGCWVVDLILKKW